AAGYAEACDVVADGYPVPRAGIREMAERYGDIVARAEAIRCYVVRREGRAIASATAMRDGATVGLWNVATLPEARRHGAATTATLAALDDARTTGASLAVLASTPEALGLYERSGFVEAGE